MDNVRRITCSGEPSDICIAAPNRVDLFRSVLDPCRDIIGRSSSADISEMIELKPSLLPVLSFSDRVGFRIPQLGSCLRHSTIEDT